MTKTIHAPIVNYYHIWHYCSKCGRVFDHSQGTWNQYRGECCGVDWKSVPAEAKTVEIEINAPGTEIINRQ